MPEEGFDLGTFEQEPLGEFTLEVLEDVGNPVKGLGLKVTVDTGEEKTRKTDDNGTIHLTTPESSLKVALSGKETS